MNQKRGRVVMTNPLIFGCLLIREKNMLFYREKKDMFNSFYLLIFQSRITTI